MRVVNRAPSAPNSTHDPSPVAVSSDVGDSASRSRSQSSSRTARCRPSGLASMLGDPLVAITPTSAGLRSGRPAGWPGCRASRPGVPPRRPAAGPGRCRRCPGTGSRRAVPRRPAVRLPPAALGRGLVPLANGDSAGHAGDQGEGGRDGDQAGEPPAGTAAVARLALLDRGLLVGDLAGPGQEVLLGVGQVGAGAACQSRARISRSPR